MDINLQIGLTVVMPVGHLKNDFENILDIAEKTHKSLIRLILVLDDQPIELEETLVEAISRNGWESVFVTSGSWHNPGSARNHGFKFCSTVWVAFWDSDDCPNIEGILGLLAELNSGQYDIGLGEFQVSKNGQLLNEDFQCSPNSMEKLETRIIANPGVWRFIFNHNFVKEIKFGDFSSAEDQLYLQRVFALLPRVKNSKKRVYTYIKGGKFQLTGAIGVAGQTLEVLNIGVHEITTHPKEFTRIRVGLLIKQMASVIKHGSLREKIQVIPLTFQLWVKVGLRELVSGINLFYKAKKVGFYFGRL